MRAVTLGAMHNRTAALVLVALLCPYAALAEPLRVLAIGDSITQGGKTTVKEYTYRWPLARMLEDEGVCVDFIGSRSAGLEPAARWPSAWDADHEGYYGATTDYVRGQLAEHLPRLPQPSIALVHLGTNDKGADTIKGLRSIVAMLRKSNSRVAVLVAQIPVSGVYEHFKVMRMATELSAPTALVLAVDHYSDWNATEDTFDGVHPNLKGQRKMAERWLAAMRPLMQEGQMHCGEGFGPPIR